ncbi:MAG TPA: LuxR C-terminal-related transcriptional regulator [Anaerolineales bacterium]|jgi:LuxR family maltose regulon positive regulatory protein
MSGSLLATKFYIPRPRENGVARPRLTEKILRGIGQPGSIVLVSGPAGFGKTTVLSEFVAQYARPVAWLSLDEGDNDAIRFWTYLINACQRVENGLGSSALELFSLPQMPPVEAILPVLINELAGLGSELVLVLDDLHALQNEEIQHSLAYLIDHLPEKIHLVAGTRIDPAWPLARLRARNQLIEIRAADLRFNSAESSDFLAHLLGFELPKEQLETLEARTEGWAAGLQLAALSMQGRSDTSAFIKNFSGSHLYIAEYLVDEVFKNQPARVQAFLLQTSILDRLNAGLCEALTGQSDASSTLLELKRANLFVIPLDDDGQWFRYHHLFADLLKAHLRQTSRLETINQLHERAAGWYQEAGMQTEAIEHSISAGNYSAALRIIEETALTVILQGHVRTVETWLRNIPAELVNENPGVKLACAWMYLLRGRMDLAKPYLEHLKEYFSRGEAGNQNRALQGEWLAIQAKILDMQGQPGECIKLARQALEMLPRQDSLVRTLLNMELAIAHQVLGDFEQAAEYFLVEARDARTRGDQVSELLATSGRGRMTLLQGKLSQTLQIASQGLERNAASGKTTPFSATLLGEIAQVHYFRHELDQAEAYLQRSVQASGMSGYIDLEMLYHLFHARLRHMQGNWPGAEKEMQKISELMRISPPAMLRESVVSEQVRVDLALGRPEEARSRLEAEGVQPDQPGGEAPGAGGSNPAFGLLYNSALRYQLYMAQNGQAAVDLKKLAELAGTAFEAQFDRQLLPDALETLLLRSQIRLAQGEEASGLADVSRTVQLAMPEGFICPFVEEGLPVANALKKLSGQPGVGTKQLAFIRKILAAFDLPQAVEASSHLTQRSAPRPDGHHPATEVLPLVEALTNRELEVLRLVAEGASNQQISEKLFITVSAVKKHTANIYAKLNVNSRTQAVARARQLDLLPAG